MAGQLRRARWEWVLITSIITPIGLWVRALRWHYLFPRGSDPPALVAATMIGYMANMILPLRAGEVVRVYVVAQRRRVGFWTTLATVVIERVLDGLTIISILAVLVLVIPVPRYVQWGAGVLLALNLVLVGVLVSFAVAPGLSRRIITAVTRPWPRLRAAVLRVFERFVRGLEGIRTPAHLLPLLVGTVLVWVTAMIPGWTMLRALDLSLPWTAPWAVLAFIGAGISIPSAPGYVGVFHAAATVALEVFGVPRSEALGYALLLHAAEFVPIVLVGWFFAVREHVKLGDAVRARPTDEGTEAPGLQKTLTP